MGLLTVPKQRLFIGIRNDVQDKLPIVHKQRLYKWTKN